MPDRAVHERWTTGPLGGIQPALEEPEGPVHVNEKAEQGLRDVNDHPISTITRRYERLGWSAKTGNAAKDDVIRKGLAAFSPVTTPTGVVKILSLTDDGEEYLRENGVLRERGRHGGAEHEYWKAVIRERLERLGYAVTEEAPVGGGKTVDLHAKHSEKEIWVEVETGRSDISANIAKLAVLGGRKAVVFTTKPLLTEHEAMTRETLGSNALLLTTGGLEDLR